MNWREKMSLLQNQYSIASVAGVVLGTETCDDDVNTPNT